jgi:hypothetical protein
MADVTGRILDKGGAYYNVRHPDFGAIGDGVFRGTTQDPTPNDRYRIQLAIDAAQADGRKVYIPAGRYMLDGPLVIKRDLTSRLTHFAIQGEFASSVYKTALLGGTILQAPAGKDAVKTVTPTGATSGYWTEHLELSDLCVVGPGFPGDGPASTTGFNLEGVFFGRFHNLHAEGFGKGLRLANGSECWFTGLTLAQNNYYGAVLERTAVDSDLQAWFENLVTVNNQENLLLDQVRSVWIEKGENISLFGPTAPRHRIQVRNGNNTQISIRNYVLEVHPHITGYDQNDQPIRAADSTVLPAVQVDSHGLSLLSLEGINFETVPATYVPTLVQCDGYFDRIEVRDSALPRALLLNTVAKQPLVHLRNPADQGGAYPNDRLRAMDVVLQGNSPGAADTWVRDEVRASATVVYRDPLHDYVPAGYQQVNPRPQVDEANDNRLAVAGGPYGFTTANPLAGKGRLYWVNVTPANAVTLAFPRPLGGVRTLYVTLIAYVPLLAGVPDANWIPRVSAIAGVAAGELYSQTAELERYTVGASVFTKFAISVAISQPSAPLQSITIDHFYGGSNLYGLETLNVYVDQRDAGVVEAAPRRRQTAPSAATDGAHVVGDVVYNLTPASGEWIGWVCTVAGVPGTWNGFGLIATP